MKGLKRRFTSFGTWIGGILLAIVLLPKDISHWVVIGFTAFWLLVKCSGPVWQRITKSYNWLKCLVASYEAKEEKKLKENLEELKLQVQQAENQEAVFEGSTMIDRQLNTKITEKLQTLYPDASWSWISSKERPSALANGCAAGRIKIMNAQEYNQAEVNFLANGQIEIKMMAIKSFEEIQANKQELTVDEWYASKALAILRDIIDELFSCGIKTMQLTSQGELLVGEVGDKKSYGILPNMPGLNDWPRLIELMVEDDIKATQINNGLILSWS